MRRQVDRSGTMRNGIELYRPNANVTDPATSTAHLDAADQFGCPVNQPAPATRDRLGLSCVTGTSYALYASESSVTEALASSGQRHARCTSSEPAAAPRMAACACGASLAVLAVAVQPSQPAAAESPLEIGCTAPSPRPERSCCPDGAALLHLHAVRAMPPSNRGPGTPNQG